MAKRFLTLEEIVAEAMSIIPGATSDDELFARPWAYIALRQIGPNRDYIDVCELYPEDLTFKKPDDFQRVLDIALFDASGNELVNKYRFGGQRIHKRYSSGTQTTVGSGQDLSIEISEDDHFFYMSSNGSAVSVAKLRYFRLPVDAEGFPQFPEDTRLAVMLFIRYMWSLKNMMPDVNALKMAWEEARNAARSSNKVLNGLELKQIAKEWISMLPNNKFDRF